VNDDHDELRMLLGAYLLGGLGDADRDRFDAHLRDCDSCRAEADRLGPVPELLQRLPAADRVPGGEAAPAVTTLALRPSPERVESLLARMRAERSRDRRRARVGWLAAAAVIVIAAAVGIGVLTNRQNSRPPEALPSPEFVVAHFEAAAGSGLQGEATVTPRLWGVSVALDVHRLGGAAPFRCEVHGMAGQIEQAAIWGPTPSGSAKVTGASSLQIASVRMIAVTDRNGHVLGTAQLE
jgi:anti-sigma factor RsiW